MTADLREMNEKLQYFKDVTQVEDSALAEQILEAHGWDLGEAVATMVDKNVQGGGALSQTDAQGPVQGVAAAAAEEHASALGRDPGPATAGPSVYRTHNPERWNPTRFDYDRFVDEGMSYERLGEHRDALQVARNTGGPNHNPNMVWRMVTLPFSIIRGGYNLMYGAVGMGMWFAGGMLNYSLGALGFGGPEQRAGDGNMLLTVPAGTAEAAAFLRNFESEYGEYHPTFQVTSFMEALRRAGQQFKFLFVYLHSPEHANTPPFCERSLCNEHVVQFVNENFVAWGGDVRTSEGFQMSNSLKASTFPFCAVVMGSSNQRIALLQQVSLDTGVKICTSLFIQKNVLFESSGSFEAHL
jgi:FAS-associated factor 2